VARAARRGRAAGRDRDRDADRRALRRDRARARRRGRAGAATVTLVLLLGGARSGKSRLAVRLARQRGGPVVFVATGEPGDDEMAERIARHRAERPPAWTTVEEPVALRDALAAAPDGATVVVDCLSLWVANLIE